MERKIPELTGYAYGQRPKVDEAIDRLNSITIPYGGGIALAQTVNSDGTPGTCDAFLKYPDWTPEEARVRISEAVKSIIDRMTEI